MAGMPDSNNLFDDHAEWEGIESRRFSTVDASDLGTASHVASTFGTSPDLAARDQSVAELPSIPYGSHATDPFEPAAHPKTAMFAQSASAFAPASAASKGSILGRAIDQQRQQQHQQQHHGQHHQSVFGSHNHSQLTQKMRRKSRSSSFPGPAAGSLPPTVSPSLALASLSMSSHPGLHQSESQNQSRNQQQSQYQQPHSSRLPQHSGTVQHPHHDLHHALQQLSQSQATDQHSHDHQHGGQHLQAIFSSPSSSMSTSLPVQGIDPSLISSAASSAPNASHFPAAAVPMAESSSSGPGSASAAALTLENMQGGSAARAKSFPAISLHRGPYYSDQYLQQESNYPTGYNRNENTHDHNAQYSASHSHYDLTAGSQARSFSSLSASPTQMYPAFPKADLRMNAPRTRNEGLARLDMSRVATNMPRHPSVGGQQAVMGSASLAVASRPGEAAQLSISAPQHHSQLAHSNLDSSFMSPTTATLMATATAFMSIPAASFTPHFHTRHQSPLQSTHFPEIVHSAAHQQVFHPVEQRSTGPSTQHRPRQAASIHLCSPPMSLESLEPHTRSWDLLSSRRLFRA
ncbi:hypothetical protein BC831DRAFT_97058 [Entophlyctis helioformis]|nr:hypothetical protein BC831DRAFT_97058 [Entophlyctis helioformis]